MIFKEGLERLLSYNSFIVLAIMVEYYMSEEEILAIIKRHPEVIVEALEKKPNALTSLMLKLAPWDRFATKEDIKMLLEFMEKRFEDINKRFEDLRNYSDKRFEELRSYSDKRFEAIDKRFEDINHRFEDLTHYIDKRVGLVEKLLIGFNIPILITIIITLVRLILY
ncbi:MAG: hypothetical protein QW589_03645 [Candidatus Bathyarchaeia archaeon]